MMLGFYKENFMLSFFLFSLNFLNKELNPSVLLLLEERSCYFPPKASSVDLQRQQGVAEQIEEHQRRHYTWVQLTGLGLTHIWIRVNEGCVSFVEVEQFYLTV